MRVLIWSEYVLLREGLCRLIKESDEGASVTEASSGEDALKSVHAARPDVILLHMGEGVSRISHLRMLQEDSPNVPVVLLLDNPNDDVILGALQSGAAGCLDRSVGSRALIQALRDAADGEISLSPVFARRLARIVGMTGQDGRRQVSLDTLTARELDVLGLLAKGMTNREIAGSLFVSESTIRAHLRTATQKLGVHNRVHAVARAMELGIVPPPSSQASSAPRSMNGHIVGGLMAISLGAMSQFIVAGQGALEALAG